jgi:hypothetical protein
MSNGSRALNVIKLMRWFRKTARISGPILDMTNAIYHPSAKDSAEIIQAASGATKPSPSPTDKPNKKASE